MKNEKYKESGLTRKIAQWAASLGYEQLPEFTIERSKQCILDSIGTAIAGTETLPSRIVWEMVLGHSSTTAESSILGRDKKLPASEAAWINGTSAHSVELDDFYRQGVVHPAVTIIPSALAAAEKAGASGAELLRAVIIGYEAVCRVGTATGMAQYDRGFHPTSTCGVFGAALAAGVLIGLEAEKLGDAMGIAGSFAGGLREWRTEGDMTKPLQAGRAAQNGIIGALLASRGYTGPKKILEGVFGFARAYAGDEKLVAGFETLGEQFEIDAVSFKPYASCRFTHPAIEAVLILKDKHAFAYEEVKGVHIQLPREMYRGVMWPEERKYNPQTISDAQFSLPFCVAAALVRGKVQLSEFTASSLSDSKILGLSKLVKAEVTDVCESVFPAMTRQIVSITLHDGSSFETQVDHAKGDTQNPMSAEELADKFRSLAGGIVGSKKADQAIEIISKLEKEEQLDNLYKLLTREKEV